MIILKLGKGNLGHGYGGVSGLHEYGVSVSRILYMELIDRKCIGISHTVNESLLAYTQLVIRDHLPLNIQCLLFLISVSKIALSCHIRYIATLLSWDPLTLYIRSLCTYPC